MLNIGGVVNIIVFHQPGFGTQEIYLGPKGKIGTPILSLPFQRFS